MNRIKVLTVKFKNEIRQSEIAKFRGAVVAMLQNNNMLFHNHTEDNKLRYAYPLIQYKRIGGKAAIVCVGEGTEAIGEFFASPLNPLHGGLSPLHIGDHDIVLELDIVKAGQILVQVWESDFVYQMRKWLPLNQENYVEFQTVEDLKSRCEFLERILVGNILSFAKGLGIHFDKEVKASIISFEEKGEFRFKMINFAAFDVKFKSNVTIPNFVGLGKGVSHGFGTVVKIVVN
jgi:hypothetical protein